MTTTTIKNGTDQTPDYTTKPVLTKVPTFEEALQEKLNQILDQQERILEQQDEIIDLLLENGLSKGGYATGSGFDFED